MLVEIKKAKKEEKPTRYDKQGRPITHPDVLMALDAIEAIPFKERTPKDRIRLAGLRKNGDEAINKNKLKEYQTSRKPPRRPTIAEINNAPDTKTPTKEQMQQVINEIYDGKNTIQALKDNNIKPKVFFNEIKREHNYQLAKDFNLARESSAEYLIYKRELLEQQLLAGEIDTSTYCALSNDLKYMASRLYPRVWGDKVVSELNINHSQAVTVDASRVQALNSLLNGLPAPFDAEFEEV